MFLLGYNMWMWRMTKLFIKNHYLDQKVKEGEIIMGMGLCWKWNVTQKIENSYEDKIHQ